MVLYSLIIQKWGLTMSDNTKPLVKEYLDVCRQIKELEADKSRLLGAIANENGLAPGELPFGMQLQQVKPSPGSIDYKSLILDAAPHILPLGDMYRRKEKKGGWRITPAKKK